MISLRQLLEEATAIFEKDAEQLVASKVAKKLGLTYKGFGRWADPKTNKIVAKTIDGKLVKVAPEDEEGQSDYGKGGKYDTKRGMQQVTKKLDAPSGQPFTKPTGKPSSYAKTNTKLIQTLQKNKDRIDNDEAMLSKATDLVKKMNVTQGVRPEDIDYLDTIAQEYGVEGLVRADQLISDTYNVKTGEFNVEFDYLDRPATYDHPDEYATTNMTVDSLEELWDRVTWRNTPYGETWDFEPPEPDYGSDSFDDRYGDY